MCQSFVTLHTHYIVYDKVSRAFSGLNCFWVNQFYLGRNTAVSFVFQEPFTHERLLGFQQHVYTISRL